MLLQYYVIRVLCCYVTMLLQCYVITLSGYYTIAILQQNLFYIHTDYQYITTSITYNLTIKSTYYYMIQIDR